METGGDITELVRPYLREHHEVSEDVLVRLLADWNQQGSFLDFLVAKRLMSRSVAQTLEAVRKGPAQPIKTPKIVMADASEITLEMQIQRLGRLPAPRIAQIGLAVAAALEAARQAGRRHRNLTPANIRASDEGQVTLIDSERAAGRLPADGVSDPAYMAPEQVTHPEDRDFRTDMYGLGATLYHAAVGRPPLLRATPAATMQAQVHDEPVPIWQLNPSFDIHLAATIHRLLRKNPAERFASWDDVRAALGYVPVVDFREPLVRNANGFFLRDSQETEAPAESGETAAYAEDEEPAESAEAQLAAPPVAPPQPPPPLQLGAQKSPEPLFGHWASLPPSRQTTLVGMLLLVVLLACVWFGMQT